MLITTKKRRKLWVDRLESREAPAVDFQILSLTANNVATVEHAAVTGDDRGGIAASSSQVFVTGGTTTGRFQLADLSGGTAVGTKYDALVSNLRNGKVYTLATNATTPLPSGGGTVTHLIEINGATGALTGTSIALSASISLTTGAGLFSGYDRIVVRDSSLNAREIALPSGTVTTLGSLGTLNANPSNSWAIWGVTEHFGGNDFVAYVAPSFFPGFIPVTNIDRMQIGFGFASNIATFLDLGDMASFTVSPTNDRWYFHNEGDSQFYTGAPLNDDEILGFGDATFLLPGIVVTNTDDSGAGSLRQALIDADASAGFDVITFAPGVNGTITLLSNLTFGDAVEIQGPGSATVTVAGSSGNLLFVPAPGNPHLTLSGLKLTNSAPQAFFTDVTTKGDVVIDTGSQDVTFAGSLTVQSGTLNVVEGGLLDLGPLTAVSGTLTDVQGFQLGSGESLSGNGTVNGEVAIGSGGTLAGSLTINGNVTTAAGGGVSPGTSPGAITINGNLDLSAGGTLTIEMNGTAANQYDRLDVNGTVNLGSGTNLLASLGFAAVPGNSFVLIANDGSDPVVGQLNGIRNRAGITIGAKLFQVRYDGGDGNDVELVCNSAPVLDINVTSTLTPILEDTPPASNIGSKIYDLVGTGALYSDAQGLFRSGIAVTGLDTANGVWQYSVDGGGNWTTFGSVSDTSATLFESDAAGLDRVRFLPNANFYGTPSFSFQAWDVVDGNTNGATGVNASAGGGNAAFSSATEVATLPVLSVNDAPDAVNDTANLNEDGGAQAIDVLVNDTFAPDIGETILISTVTQGAHGTVAITGGGTGLTYTPNLDYSGPDSFLYSIADGNGGSDFASVTVNVVNDAGDRLEVVTSSGITDFDEKLPPLLPVPVVVDAGIEIGSALEGVLSSATVKFASGYVPKKDTLTFVTMGAIKGKFNAKTGVLTLTGIASPDNYEAALRTVMYLNKSPAPVDGIRTIAFQLKDAAGTGDAAGKLLRVNGVNTKPTLTLTSPPLTYKTRGKLLAVAGNLKIKDVDNTRLVSARVFLPAGLAAGAYLLTATQKFGIVPVFDNVNNVLTLTGNATVANYLTVLKSLKFSATVAAPAGAVTISITVNDGLLESDAATRVVNVL